MDPITLVPHHCVPLLLKKRDYHTVLGAYDGVQAKAGNQIFQQIITNPNQLVEIVISLDSLCSYCPHNPKGYNYNPKMEPLNCYQDATVDRADAHWIKHLNLEGILNKPVTSSELFNIMEENLLYNKVRKFFKNIFTL